MIGPGSVIGAEWVLAGDSRGLQDRDGYLRARDAHRARDNARAVLDQLWRVVMVEPPMRLAWRLVRGLMARAVSVLLALQQQARDNETRLATIVPASEPEAARVAGRARTWVRMRCVPHNGPNVAGLGTWRLGMAT